MNVQLKEMIESLITFEQKWKAFPVKCLHLTLSPEAGVYMSAYANR